MSSRSTGSSTPTPSSTWGAFLPLLLLSRYTGRHGTSGGFSKWFFYMFYPPPPAGPGLAPGRAVSLGPHDPQGPGPAGDESIGLLQKLPSPTGPAAAKREGENMQWPLRAVRTIRHGAATTGIAKGPKARPNRRLHRSSRGGPLHRSAPKRPFSFEPCPPLQE